VELILESYGTEREEGGPGRCINDGKRNLIGEQIRGQ